MTADLSILTADQDNASVTLNTLDNNRKIGAFLQDLAWRSLAKDTTETVEHLTTLKELALAEEVSFCRVINN